ncbi:hypothetical protein EMCRGX_G008018, partial [Ephydatia muelleri]
HEQEVQVDFNLQVTEDFTWTLHYGGKKLKYGSGELLNSLPEFIKSVEHLCIALTAIDKCKVCIGNYDNKFQNLMTKEHFRDSGSQVIAIVDTTLVGNRTIRHSQCEILILADEVRCIKCHEYRKRLHMMVSRLKQQQHTDTTHPSSHANYRFLTPSQLCSRLRNLHKEHENVRRKYERLKKRLALYCDSDGGVEVDDTLHQDLKVIMQENSSKFSLSPDSFEKVFWEQQEQAASVQKASLMRWHPLMIKWCLYLRHLSGSAYELLHNSGLKLPSQRTLRDYSYISPTSIGFSNQVDQQLMEAANIAECEEFQKCVLLLVDEVHIKEDLVFDKHSGELLGYINLGETNNQLLDLERLVSDDQNQELASSIIVIMVRGLFTRLCFPYAQFSASTLSGD